MRRILITGAAGFLGSNLSEALVARGDEVIGLDNFSEAGQENLTTLLGSERFSLVEGDVRDQATMQPLCDRVDAVVHLAAWKIPRYGNALKTLDVNGLGSYQVLSCAARRGVRTLIASTSDIYGRNPQVPFHEESASVIGSSQVKRWSYAISKLFAEHLAWAFQQEHNLPVSVMRYFGGYGPHQRLSWTAGPQSVFITNALHGEPLPLHGTGEQRRTFTYVSDLIDGTIRILDEPRAIGEAINLGATTETRIVDLARLIWQLIHGASSEPQLTMVPYESFGGRYEDVQRRIPDVSKAQQLLGGLTASVSLEQGLAQTIAWQRQQLAARQPSSV